MFFSLVVFIGFFGNLLVVLVASFNKQMRNTTNLLILNLAVADILFIVFCVPFTATGYALPHDWPFGDLWYVRNSPLNAPPPLMGNDINCSW